MHAVLEHPTRLQFRGVQVGGARVVGIAKECYDGPGIMLPTQYRVGRHWWGGTHFTLRQLAGRLLGMVREAPGSSMAGAWPPPCLCAWEPGDWRGQQRGAM